MPKPATPFEPFIAAGTRIREFTPRAVIVGTLLGMVFGASSLYLVLKVGLTVSASIPVAVISITLFRLWAKARRPGRDDPREQHRPDGRSRGRVDRVRRRRHHAGDHDPGLRPGSDARDARRGARRPARHPDDDPAAPRADRAAARRAEVSRRHRLRRGAEGGRIGRITRGCIAGRKGRARRQLGGDLERGDHLRRLRHRPRLQDADDRASSGWKDMPDEDLRRAAQGGSIAAEISPELLGVGYIIGPRIALDHVRGRRARLPGADPADQVLRRRPAGRHSRRARCRSAT